MCRNSGFVTVSTKNLAHALLRIAQALRWILAGVMLVFSILLISGAFFQDEMPFAEKQTFTPSPVVPTPTGRVSVAACPDCYYSERTPEELEFAERTWQEQWGKMPVQEFMNGAVLER